MWLTGELPGDLQPVSLDRSRIHTETTGVRRSFGEFISFFELAGVPGTRTADKLPRAPQHQVQMGREPTSRIERPSESAAVSAVTQTLFWNKS
jgi:hypothetical protein